MVIRRNDVLNIDRSFFALLGALGLRGRSLISSLLLLLLPLSLKSSLLLLDDLLVFLDGLGVELDGGMAAAAVVPIPVLRHEYACAATWAVLLEVGHIAVVYNHSRLTVD
jgi:hypothetical protein